MSNPLLVSHALPPFSRMEVSHIKPAIEALITRNKNRIDELLAQRVEAGGEVGAVATRNLDAPGHLFGDHGLGFSPLAEACGWGSWRDRWQHGFDGESIHR